MEQNSLRLDDWIFEPVDMEKVELGSEARWEQKSGSYNLILAAQGQGTILAPYGDFPVASGDAYISGFGTAVTKPAHYPADFIFYAVCFEAFRLRERTDRSRQYELDAQGLPCLGKAVSVPMRESVHLAETLLQRKLLAGDHAQLRRRTGLMDLLACVTDRGSLVPDLPTANPITGGIDYAVAYLEEHYAETISINSLARKSGYHPVRFSEIFKRRMGTSPLEYLISLRIRRAQELLLLTDGGLKAVANAIGYADELYLSRLFKKRTGQSPTAYVRQRPQRIVCTNAMLTRHVEALGLEAQTIAIGSCAKADRAERLTRLREQQPELIFGYDLQLDWKEALGRIAPVIMVPWSTCGVLQQFQLIARVLGKQAEAADWIKRFEAKAVLVKQEAQAKFGEERSVAIFMIYGDQVLRIYGGRNLGFVFYHALQLAPPALIGEAMRRDSNYWATDLTVEQLGLYPADRIMVAVQDGADSRSRFEAIQESAQWQSLQAVQKGRVCRLDLELFLRYDPPSLERQLDEVRKLVKMSI